MCCGAGAAVGMAVSPIPSSPDSSCFPVPARVVDTGLSVQTRSLRLPSGPPFFRDGWSQLKAFGTRRATSLKPSICPAPSYLRIYCPVSILVRTVERIDGAAGLLLITWPFLALSAYSYDNIHLTVGFSSRRFRDSRDSLVVIGVEVGRAVP